MYIFLLVTLIINSLTSIDPEKSYQSIPSMNTDFMVNNSSWYCVLFSLDSHMQIVYTVAFCWLVCVVELFVVIEEV